MVYEMLQKVVKNTEIRAVQCEIHVSLPQLFHNIHTQKKLCNLLQYAKKSQHEFYHLEKEKKEKVKLHFLVVLLKEQKEMFRRRNKAQRRRKGPEITFYF